MSAMTEAVFADNDNLLHISMANDQTLQIPAQLVNMQQLEEDTALNTPLNYLSK